MAVTITELVKSREFETTVEGGRVVLLPLPEWFPQGFTQADLDAQVARHGVGAVMALFTAQAIIDLRARVRMGKRTERMTKNGTESCEPKSDEVLVTELEKVVFSAPADTTERKLATAAKVLSGFTPEQIAALLATLGKGE